MKKTYVKDVPQLRQYLLDAYEEIKPNSITRRMIKKLYERLTSVDNSTMIIRINPMGQTLSRSAMA